MNFERPQNETRENSQELRKLHNLIQVKLMERWAIRRGLSRYAAEEEWTEGKHFSGSFSDIVKKHPELYGEYKEKPESTLTNIESMLYSGDTLEEAA